MKLVRVSRQHTDPALGQFLPMLGNIGNNPWDVANPMIPALQDYGLTVAMFFCPVRPLEFQAAQSWLQKQMKRPLINNADLICYYTQRWTYSR